MLAKMFIFSRRFPDNYAEFAGTVWLSVDDKLINLLKYKMFYRPLGFYLHYFLYVCFAVADVLLYKLYIYLLSYDIHWMMSLWQRRFTWKPVGASWL